MLSVALDLFARHGVNGTSLQMIADELGVTKAAVYHQFRSKDDIVRAVIAPALERLRAVTEEAERRRRRSERAEVVLGGIIDLVVDNRRLAAVLQSDPAITTLVHESDDVRGLERRITALLAGDGPDDETLLATVMVSGGLLIAARDPRLMHFDDERLRHNLHVVARRLLRLRAPAPPRA
ncbi:TetR/AcrR family transcriptional regulator [Actinomadura sp. PM05-2]|uniref:TetR/AcrR family transcriptional regulator n=1 Tax=Actinomadura parmotrematis TaxID=2864039 RepID=A0ABS7G793_9ACTN|nr:TetR/AcrR family transcriptional regulator [Actinomadura parmotrematis]